MKPELVEVIKSMDANVLKTKLIYEIENGATKAQVLSLVRLFKLSDEENLVTNAITRLKKEDLLSEIVPIIQLVSENYPMTTSQIIAVRNLRPVTHSRKQAIGFLMAIAGFKKISKYRQGKTPTKGWAPVDVDLSAKHRTDYLLSLLKNPFNIPDTPLNDLI